VKRCRLPSQQQQQQAATFGFGNRPRKGESNAVVRPVPALRGLNCRVARLGDGDAPRIRSCP
jgi:hypothetical protein